MIQDRTMQDLWAVVEELRQRVEELENGNGSGSPAMEAPVVATPPEPAKEPAPYVASVRTNSSKTFHARSCRYTLRFLEASDGFREFPSPTAALEAGYKLCKRCDVPSLVEEAEND